MANLAGQKQFSTMLSEGAGVFFNSTTTTAFATTTFPTLVQAKALLNDAYQQLCSRKKWSFLFDVSKTISTVASQATAYECDGAAERVLFMRIAAKDKMLQFLPYEEWIRRWPAGFTGVGDSSPDYYIPAAPGTTTPNAKAFYLFPASSAVETVSYGIKKRITVLVDDTSIPVIPPEWQDVLIKYWIADVFDFASKPEQAELWRRKAKERFSEMWLEDEKMDEWVNRINSLGGATSAYSGDFSRVAWEIGTGGS